MKTLSVTWVTKTFNSDDHAFMRAALVLARRGLGNTAPNPAVGCIVVRPDLGNRVVGRGWTQPGGRPHAETKALERAGEGSAGATAYVTLEPCCHQGKTPPCTKALIEAGIHRVVVATTDPDERVAGQGITTLRQAGIIVESGLLGTEARDLNTGFISRITRSQPYVMLKTATSLDGRIATASGQSQWITGERARQAGHALRARCDAILTGMGTVRADNPQLTCRLPGLEDHSPVRVVLDPDLDMDEKAALITSAGNTPTWIVTCSGDQARIDRITAIAGVSVLSVEADNNGYPGLLQTLTQLAKHGINRLMIEAGSKLNAAFLKQGLVDEISWFRAPFIIGADGLSAVESLDLQNLVDAHTFDMTASFNLGEDRMDVFKRSNV